MSAPERLVWVPVVGRSIDHAVTVEELATGLSAARNVIVALGGRRFFAAPVIAAPLGTTWATTLRPSRRPAGDHR